MDPGRGRRFTLGGSSRAESESTDDDRSSRRSSDDPVDSQSSIPSWSQKRHLSCGNPLPTPSWSSTIPPWRGSTSAKLKTSNAALVLCLNIDVDPPDVVKTNPCATLECWVDPHTMPSHKALEAIGNNLKHQFEQLSVRINYKPILDPSYEDLRRFCLTLRKQSKDDTVVFYYNGHGVPKPTASGELWCFNRNYTQYIPVSLQEVQGWLGSPGVYVWDCSAAGHLLHNFNVFAERRDSEVNAMHGGYVDGAQPFANSLQLAACAANETLPTCPELPADVFTSCLTSPIDMALRWFLMNHQLPNNLSPDMAMQLPGDLKDRKTPLGELNWIFTAITDTIAWTTFSRELFTRLYRSDLLTAALFRNFLLAERIMKNYNCTPHTYPPLPPTNTHPLWASWDLAVDACLRQLLDLLNKNPRPVTSLASTSGILKSPGRPSSIPTIDEPYQYVHSRFFQDQLTAFEVWISRGGSALTKRGPMSLPVSSNGEYRGDCVDGDGSEVAREQEHLVPRKPPEQLPIVLQVLLCQPHRIRALILLAQFVDLGPWAVHSVLATGLFPYISRLLLAPNLDLRPVLIFIWARILAVDPTVQVDLFTSGNFKYFANIFATKNENLAGLPNITEHRAMCAFILSAVARTYPAAQRALWQEKVFDNCVDRFDNVDYLLRQWSALCVAQLWAGNDENKVLGVDRGAQDALIVMLDDKSVEVRCAALYALGTFLGASASYDLEKEGGGGTGTMYQLDERIHFRMEVAVATGASLSIKDDASPIARRELVVVLSCLAKEWRGWFVVCAWIYWEEDRRWKSQGSRGFKSMEDDLTTQAVADWLDGAGDDDVLREENRVLLSSFFFMFTVLLEYSTDPYPEVASQAQTVLDYIMALLLTSPFEKLKGSTLNNAPSVPYDYKSQPLPEALVGNRGRRSRAPSLTSTPSVSTSSTALNTPTTSIRPSFTRTDTMTSTISEGVSKTIKRTSSFANALKHLAGNVVFPSYEDGRESPTGSIHQQSQNEVSELAPTPPPNVVCSTYVSPYPPTMASSSSSIFDGVSERTIPTETSTEAPLDFLPCDVMEALMEEDMERLRARRKAGDSSRRHQGQNGTHHGHHNGGLVPSPSSSTFSIDSNGSSVILGLGTGVGVNDVLPLRSTYYDYCMEYFREPQMRQSEPDEPGSIQYNYQVWRHQRNDQVLKEVTSQADIAHSCRWDRSIASLHVSGHPLSLTFHSFDQHLIVANEADAISVFDWSKRKRLAYFRNGNPQGTNITSLRVINEDVGGIIMSGSTDGVVRLFRDYDPTLDQGPIQMVSAFRALNEMVQMRNGSGLITEWQQSTGHLFAGGDSRVIRAWDANLECQTRTIETNCDSPVTSLKMWSPQILLAGFADGTIKAFDQRDRQKGEAFAEHTTWVQNIRKHTDKENLFLSASLDGEVKLWDIRTRDSVDTWKTCLRGLASFDVHPVTPVFATAASISTSNWRTQKVEVTSLLSGASLSSLNMSTGLTVPPPRINPSPYIPRTSSLTFHPTEMLYAVGEPDGSIRLMGCKLT